MTGKDYAPRLRRPFLRDFHKHLLLLATAVFICIGYITTRVLAFPPGWFGWIQKQFDLNAENNLTTWFATFLWMVAAYRAYRLAEVDHTRQGAFSNKLYWASLALVALACSIDEIAQIHEMTSSIPGRFGVDFIVYDWVPFGIAAFAVVGLFFLRFLLRLPRYIGATIVLAGAIFVGGAIGWESVGSLIGHGPLWRFNTDNGWTFVIAAEEFMEMTGVILLIVALQTHYRQLVLARPAVSEGPRQAA